MNLAPGPDGITRVYVADDVPTMTREELGYTPSEQLAIDIRRYPPIFGEIVEDPGPDFAALTEHARHEIAIALLAPPRPQE